MSHTLFPNPKHIAIIGAGISGLTAAHLLRHQYRIEVFEAADYIGGHTNTIVVDHQGQPLPIDTGFIVYNTRTYPLLTRLFAELNVQTEWSNMSFSVSERSTGFEYGSRTLPGLLTRWSHALNPHYWQMLRDYLRFCNEAKVAAEDPAYEHYTLLQFAQAKGYSNYFIRYCLVPAASAIWSSSHALIEGFPAKYFFEFYRNHGLLDVPTSIRWRTVTGGSHAYVRALTQPFRQAIHLNCAVRVVRRHEHGVTLTFADGSLRAFDAVVLATHTDQTLQLLADPSDAERDILNQLPYQSNLAILHTDERMLPRHKTAWASWNYTLHQPEGAKQRVSMTYWMNSLQNLNTSTNYCVTINPHDAIDERKIIKEIRYAHPQYSLASLEARHRLPIINGQRHTYFCGAWCGYGFHEDGVKSGVTVANLLGAPWVPKRLDASLLAQTTIKPQPLTEQAPMLPGD
jgi:predicted NAD/FAD-binding protein